MKFLLPHKFRKWAWLAFFGSFFFGINDFSDGYNSVDCDHHHVSSVSKTTEPVIAFLDHPVFPILGNLLLIGTILLIVFTKDKIHDEFTEVIRYRTLSIVIIGSGVVAVLIGFISSSASVITLFVVLCQLLAYLLLKPVVTSHMTD